MNLFSPDSKFMRAMAMLGDLMLLNLVFLVCCVPVVTIGAARTALCAVCFGLDRDAGGRVLPRFFRAFRQNFRAATPLWLLLLLAGGVAALDCYLALRLGGLWWLALAPGGLLALIVLLTDAMLFPLLSQFDNSPGATLKNAALLALAWLPRSLAAAAMNVFPFAVLLADFYLFLTVGFLWAALYFSACAYLSGKLLKKVFAPYRAEEEETP